MLARSLAVRPAAHFAPAVPVRIDPTMASLTNPLQWAHPVRLATTLLALWRLFKHADAPWAPKLVAFAVLAYAVSPIDLIPDFIPVLGMLDDWLLIPLGVALAVRLTPPALWQACLDQARAGAKALPQLWWGAAAVLSIWLLLLGALGRWAWALWASAGSGT